MAPIAFMGAETIARLTRSLADPVSRGRKAGRRERGITADTTGIVGRP